MSYAYSDLITDFRNLLRDPVTLNNKFFTDAEILVWAADANMEMVREVGLHIFTTTLAITVFEGELYDAITAGDTDTEITADNVTGSVVAPVTGNLTIENAAGDTQTYKYYARTLATGKYTFSIDSTEADYSFAANDTVTIYKREYSFPTDVIKIVSVVDRDNKRILPTTINALDEFDGSWRDKTGQVDFYYPTHEKGTALENPEIGFHRAPTSAQHVVIRSWKLPTSSSAANTGGTAPNLGNASVPEVEEALCKLLLDFVLAKGYRARRDFSQYDNLMAKFYKVNIPLAKKFFHRDEDRIMALGSNEGQSGIAIGRYPEWYPKFSKW